MISTIPGDRFVRAPAPGVSIGPRYDTCNYVRAWTSRCARISTGGAPRRVPQLAAEKKGMSRLVPEPRGARMAPVSTLRTKRFSRGRHDGHEYACCGGRDPARDSGTDVGSRDSGASWSAPAEQVEAS